MSAKTILFVDDSATERQLMQQALQGKGYNLVTANDGEEALKKISQKRPDLILLDIVLPGKNGFQVCRHLKTSPGTKDIKVILISSKNQESDRFWGLKQGADEYLTKPVSPEALLASIGRHT